MFQVALALALLIASAYIVVVGTKWFVARHLFLPEVIRASEALHAPRRLAVGAFIATFVLFALSVIAAGSLGLPARALIAIGDALQQPRLSLRDGLGELVARVGLVAVLSVSALIAMLVWTVGVAVERFHAYRQVRRQSEAYAPQAAGYLNAGRVSDAIALSASREFRDSHLAKVVLAGLQEYEVQRAREGTRAQPDVLNAVRDELDRATDLTSKELNTRLSTLATIGATAPFVGLLGTVVGVTKVFATVGTTGSFAAVATGVSEALVATALGLFVAIPAVWLHNVLVTRREYFEREMRELTSITVMRLEKLRAT